MLPLCKTDNIALTPYSALASGRLSRLPGEDSKRLQEDFYAKLKYQNTETQDLEIIRRVNEISEKYDVSMTEVSLAWLLEKVTSPIVGATKMHHVDGAVNAVNLKLSSKDMTIRFQQVMTIKYGKNIQKIKYDNSILFKA